jgi:hypothetical protein
MLPAVVLPLTEADVDKRPPFGPFGLSDQMHPGLMGQTVALAGIAGNAGTDDVFPGRLPAAVPGHHVIQIQINAVENPVAVLAGVPVAFKNIVPGELDLFLGQALKKQQHNDAGHAHPEADRPGHFGLGIGLGKIFPAFEIVGEKIIPLVSGNHLGVSLVKKRERPAGRTGIHRLPKAIKHKNRLIKDGFHIRFCVFCAPFTGGMPEKLAEASIAVDPMSTLVDNL